jgi:transposase
MKRGELTDSQWAKLRPLLPPQRSGKAGRPPHNHRRMLDGMLWVLRTGAPWRDLPRRYGPWASVACRFYRWRRQGVLARMLARMLAALEARGDAEGRLDWSAHYVDGTVVRAHQHAAGAAHSDAEREGLGRSRGGFSTKVHVRAEGGGKPVTFIVTPGQRHDSMALEPLMEQGAVGRAGGGRPRLRPHRVVGDKGYSYPRVRRYLRRRGIGATIPTRKDQRRLPHFDRVLYRTRNLVERLINRLKQFRRVATRYEKRVANYLAMLSLAAIILWL